MQSLTIAGNVGKDPELRTTQGGDKVLGFSLAVDNGKDNQGNKRPATWYDVSIWGKRAEALNPHIAKGDKLVLRGRPNARAHEGKAYLGISVDDLTFMGKSNTSAEGGDGYQSSPPGGGYGAPDDLGDGGDIPF